MLTENSALDMERKIYLFVSRRKIIILYLQKLLSNLFSCIGIFKRKNIHRHHHLQNQSRYFITKRNIDKL